MTRGRILAIGCLVAVALAATPALLAPALGWALAALCARLGRRWLLAGTALALALLAAAGSFFLALPLAVVLPLVADAPSPLGGHPWCAGWLAAACALLLVALLAGLIVGAVGAAAFG